MNDPNKTAVMNIGSNSVKMLAESDGGSYYRRTISCQLARGAKDGLLADESINRSLSAVKELYGECKRQNAEKIYIYATEAVRSSQNGHILTDAIERELGIKTDVIDGETEARYSLLGALSLFPDLDALIDIGGASTEFALSGGDGKVSLPIGAVRLTENRGDGLSKRAAAALSPLSRYKGSVKKFVGVSGTFCSLAVIVSRLTAYDESNINGTALNKEDLSALFMRTENMSGEQIFDLYPLIGQARARVLSAGLAIALAALETVGCEEITVSTADGLNGYMQTVKRELHG